MELYMDEKWKLSKKGSRNGCSGCEGGGRRGGGAVFLKRSPSSGKGGSFTRRCAALVKEQRARFYIMRRCVTMLICWREYRDS
ncbi:unnamed protein product [Spirodela intermedia]|uniref:Uncharacterized protein n=1 Tax=Spirodela intermedia TaxID=51605 RepID=A0A7I8JGV4_SPIIN|nr:unnamed protein product [Spirodela intermedia]CAA6669389.1 unnamed protein product [Spirodela intermedia]